MKEREAETLVGLVGGTRWHIGGGIWIVRMTNEDGHIVLLSNEGAEEYRSEDDVYEGMPLRRISFLSSVAEPLKVEFPDAGLVEDAAPLLPHQRLIEHPDGLVSVAGICQATGEPYESAKMTPGFFDGVMSARDYDHAPYVYPYWEWVMVRHGVLLPERYKGASGR